MGVIDEVNRTMARYWWAGENKDKGIHWKKWEYLTSPKVDGGLGFKDLECMNLALLARQGWRIMTRQASLLYRVLKGRYFRNSSFLNAKVGSNSSFGWQSLMAGNKVLKKGIRWRVGDGKSIDIWRDPWVPRATDFSVRGTPREGPKWVSQLLNNGAWDRVMAETILEGEDLERVLAIPLSKHHIQDRLVWNHTRNGLYLTSSGYITAMKMKQNGELRVAAKGESSEQTGGFRGWKSLWQLMVPPRVKLFLWKCLHNILPTRDNLARRGMKGEKECVLCSLNSESSLHLLVTCPFSRRFWFASPWQLLTGEGTWTSFKEWWIDITARLPTENRLDVLSQVGCVLWSLWKYRNSIVFGEERRSWEDSLHEGICLAVDYKAANASSSTGAQITALADFSGASLQRWCSPAPSRIKINVDAAWRADSSQVTVGVVARDFAGQFVAARFRALPQVQSALVAEALALREGMQFILEHKWSSIELEGDSNTLIRILNGQMGMILEVDVLLWDVLRWATNLDAKFRFTKRSGNNVAHLIAHWNSGLEHDVTWNAPPHWLVSALIADCNA